MPGDFHEQAGRPYEHEARLKELLTRQAELNTALDLDKGERQIAPPAGAEGRAGADGDAGADETAVSVAAHAGTPHASNVITGPRRAMRIIRLRLTRQCQRRRGLRCRRRNR
jgi:hypothetical protein